MISLGRKNPFPLPHSKKVRCMKSALSPNQCGQRWREKRERDKDIELERDREKAVRYKQNEHERLK